MVAGSSRGARPPANLMNVIDTRTNVVAWSLVMNPAPSPMAISKNPDGSTKWIFAQNGSANGFAVVDFATQAKVNEVKLPDIPAEKRNTHGGPSASHGIWVTADQKTLLVVSRLNSSLYAYSIPDLKLVGTAALGGKGAVTSVGGQGRLHSGNAPERSMHPPDCAQISASSRGRRTIASALGSWPICDQAPTWLPS